MGLRNFPRNFISKMVLVSWLLWHGMEAEREDIDASPHNWSQFYWPPVTLRLFSPKDKLIGLERHYGICIVGTGSKWLYSISHSKFTCFMIKYNYAFIIKGTTQCFLLLLRCWTFIPHQYYWTIFVWLWMTSSSVYSIWPTDSHSWLHC